MRRRLNLPRSFSFHEEGAAGGRDMHARLLPLPLQARRFRDRYPQREQSARLSSFPPRPSLIFQSPTSTLSFPGNWCGPNFGSGIPIDAVDATCERHDNCYDAAVRSSAGNKWAENAAKCTCDTVLMNEVTALKADQSSYPLLAEAARTTVDGILTVFKYKCGVVAVYDTFKEMAREAKANREAKKAAEAAATAQAG